VSHVKKKPTAVDAKRYLAEVGQPWTAFWCHKGPIVKSIAELSLVLPKMPEATFKHHVTEAKNDFASWVEAVIGDKELADAIRATKAQKSMAKAVADRKKELEKCLAVDPETKKAKAKAA
jgi:hypothetical protein